MLNKLTNITFKNNFNENRQNCSFKITLKQFVIRWAVNILQININIHNFTDKYIIHFFKRNIWKINTILSKNDIYI